MEEGIVAGGGVALIRAQKALETPSKIDLVNETNDFVTGVQIVKKAIEAPLKTIVQNAGGSAEVIINEVRNGKGNLGYNARTEEYVDMVRARATNSEAPNYTIHYCIEYGNGHVQVVK